MEDKELKKEIAEYWNESSIDYDTHPGHGLGGDDEKEAWLKFLGEIVPGGTKTILDVGCGTGFLTVLLAELGYTIKGVDLSEGMQADAKRKVKENGFEDRVSFAIGDAENLDEESDTYDLVINRHLLWTLPHPYEAIDEWLRVTRPGGYVIVIDGDWTLGKKKIEEEEPEEEEDDSGHKRGYSDEVKESLPLQKEDNSPWDFVKREGYDIEVIELTEVDSLERHKYKDDKWMKRDVYIRHAYVIRKPD